MSLWGHHVLAEDIKPTQGHKVLARMSLCGHQVPNKDFPIEDVLDRDVPFEDMSVEDNPVEDLMSTQGHDVLGWMSLCRHHVLAEDVLDGDIMSTQGRPRADVPVEDI